MSGKPRESIMSIQMEYFFGTCKIHVIEIVFRVGNFGNFH